MLNEFVSVVISGNEEHCKLMEMTCLVKRQLPVALIEVPISTNKANTGAPGYEEERAVCLCIQMYCLFVYIMCVSSVRIYIIFVFVCSAQCVYCKQYM